MKELNDLFDTWEKRHFDAGYKRFIRDGIITEEWWSQDREYLRFVFS